jgi:hypothetical protein
MKTKDTAGVIAPPPLIYLATLIIGLLLRALVPTPFLPRGLAAMSLDRSLTPAQFSSHCFHGAAFRPRRVNASSWARSGTDGWWR